MVVCELQLREGEGHGQISNANHLLIWGLSGAMRTGRGYDDHLSGSQRSGTRTKTRIDELRTTVSWWLGATAAVVGTGVWLAHRRGGWHWSASCDVHPQPLFPSLPIGFWMHHS
jgi:hypothetical protein